MSWEKKQIMVFYTAHFPPFRVIKQTFSIFQGVFVILCHLRPKIRCFFPFPNKPWFLPVFSKNSYENTVGKGQIARYEQFLLFPPCFPSIWRTCSHFHQIKNCRLQTLSVWKSLKSVVW